MEKSLHKVSESPRIQLASEIKIPINSAGQNPFTLKSLINCPAIHIKKALITSIKSPSVRSVTGRVKKISTGFTKLFSKANNIETTKAVAKLFT